MIRSLNLVGQVRILSPYIFSNFLERNVAKDTAIQYRSSSTTCKIDDHSKHGLNDPKDSDQGPTPV